MRVATDVGGTFTDYVAFDETGGRLVAAKSSTTPNIVDGIVECFRKGETRVPAVSHFVHGSTIAINTVIERKGAVTGLLATDGFRDVLELARGNIHNSFDLMFLTPEPLVPPALRRGIRERMLSDGRPLVALDAVQAARAIEELALQGVSAIAICLLHAYANPAHEAQLVELIREKHPDWYVTASSDIVRQYREYERTSTTVLNAYVGPRVGTYLGEIQRFLEREGFRGTAMIMQSNGGTMTIDAARSQPVRMMESGPVGGTMAAAYVGRRLGHANVVAFDMGGTTAKVSIVKKGEMEVAEGYYIGGEETGYPLQLPVVDIIEIGAGGGSIAHLDETGALKVGPVSAGACPGPACYGRGGAAPTVTDANLVLGRLDPHYFLGGEMQLDEGAALRAIEAGVARPLGLETIDAARGIIKLADLSMAHAVRTMTVQRGYDPREAVMIAYGGAGPLHAAAIARELGIGTVVVPPYCGIFSALGMLLADARNEYVISHIRPLNDSLADEIEALFAKTEAQAIPLMQEAGFERASVTVARALEMRYAGQEFTLIVGCPSAALDSTAVAGMRRRFNEAYEARYGHAFPDVPLEIVSVRLSVCGIFGKPALTLRSPAPSGSKGAAPRKRPVYFDGAGFVQCDVVRRDALPPGARLAGPLVVEEPSSTTVVAPGDRLHLDTDGNLVIRIGT
jgi:N-methylhydantoinase A